MGFLGFHYMASTHLLYTHIIYIQDLSLPTIRPSSFTLLGLELEICF